MQPPCNNLFMSKRECFDSGLLAFKKGLYNVLPAGNLVTVESSWGSDGSLAAFAVAPEAVKVAYLWPPCVLRFLRPSTSSSPDSKLEPVGFRCLSEPVEGRDWVLDHSDLLFSSLLDLLRPEQLGETGGLSWGWLWADMASVWTSLDSWSPQSSSVWFATKNKTFHSSIQT